MSVGARGWRSIRVPISLAMVAVTLLVMVVTGAIVDHRAATSGKERLRAQAQERLAAAVTVYGLNGELSAGASLSEDFGPAGLVDALERPGTTGSVFDGRWMWAAQRLDTGELITIRLDGEPLTQQRLELRRTLLLATGIAVLAAALLGWLAAVGLSRRLRRAAVLADARPYDAAGPGLLRAVGGRDEVAGLSAAVDDLARDLAERVERERRFGADVAHELRTPLTALVSAAELLPENDDASALVRGQVARMRRLVEDLLELFRTDTGQAGVRLVDADLATAVRSALQAGVPSVLGPVRLHVESSALVRLEPRPLERVLSNLVANARLHGGVGDDEPVDVVVDGTTLTVADDGPGLPEELVHDGPQPFRRYSAKPGSGLGLAIVRRLAGLMGATLTLANDNGAKITVTFAPSSDAQS